MVEHLKEFLHREWHSNKGELSQLESDDTAHHFQQPRVLSRKVSDGNNRANGEHIHPTAAHQHQHRQQQARRQHSMQTGPFNERSDFDDLPSPAIGRSHPRENEYDRLLSPRLMPHKSIPNTSNRLSPTKLQQLHSVKPHLSARTHADHVSHHSDVEEESHHPVDTPRQLHRKVAQRSMSHRNHDIDEPRPPVSWRVDRVLTGASSRTPFRLVFIRHSERINQALGPDWFNKAFRTNEYVPYDPNLPKYLPQRNTKQSFQLDSPLTVRGLKNARDTGEVMLNTDIVSDCCLSSTSLRCIQTAERILKGMKRGDRIPICIEPGLFECPHMNSNLVESFMTKSELKKNGYNIDLHYKPLIDKVHTPESLDQYFERCLIVMRNIIDYYGPRGGTVLIVTHAPGLLALTEAIKGLKPNRDTFYRTVSAYSPLAMCTADFDGTKWRTSERPFNITPATQRGSVF